MEFKCRNCDATITTNGKVNEQQLREHAESHDWQVLTVTRGLVSLRCPTHKLPVVTAIDKE